MSHTPLSSASKTEKSESTPLTQSSKKSTDLSKSARFSYLDRPLVLSGPPGVGKTKVSRFLAQHMKAHWVDLDHLIEKETQESIDALFKKHGQRRFRELEEQYLLELIKHIQLDSPPADDSILRWAYPSSSHPAQSHSQSRKWVISLGGGTLTNPRLHRAILTHTTLITLWASPSLLLNRLQPKKERQKRPLLAPKLSLEMLYQLLSKRFKVYQKTHLWFEVDPRDSIQTLTYRLFKYLSLDLPSPPPKEMPKYIDSLSPPSASSSWVSQSSLDTSSPSTSLPSDSSSLSSSLSSSVSSSSSLNASLSSTNSQSSSLTRMSFDSVFDEPPSSFPPPSDCLQCTSYPLYFRYNAGDELLEKLLKEKRRLFVISDDRVAPLYGWGLVELLQQKSTLDIYFLSFPHGEKNKSFDTLNSLAHQCLELGVSRSDCLVAFGGGVVGDLVGFLASILLRGVDWIQIPTTLLAQVDSSIGGKTAINHALGKNLLGSFYPPQWVWMDRLYLETLSIRQLRAGWAEALKHAFIRNLNLLEWYETSASTLVHCHQFADLHIQELLYQTLSIKRELVQKDEFEKGCRQLLNFGHTLGHAFEHDLPDCLHGEAVALGMSFALEWSHVYGVLPLEQAKRGKALLQAYQLDTDWRKALKKISLDSIKHDKKRKGNQLTLITLLHLGQAQREPVSLSIFFERLTSLSNQTSVL